MACQCRLEPLLAVLPEVGQRTAAVPTYQAEIADYVGCEDCG
jgi:hypothetical protein